MKGQVRRGWRIEKTIMRPEAIGAGYLPARVEGWTWICAACGRAWLHRWQAETCGSRGHVDMFITNGFERWCVRRPNTSSA